MEGVVLEDTAFLDFEEALQRFVSQLGYQYAGSDITIYVDDISLVYGLTCIKDNFDSGLYIPMWQINYTFSNDPDKVPWQLYFSAIDGSTVEPRLTREDLMGLLGE